MEPHTKDSFTPLLDQAFLLTADDGRILDLELVEVVGHGRPRDEVREAFSIVFRGPREPLLPQRIYRLEHAALGSLELFLVPIGQGEASTSYEAVFG